MPAERREPWSVSNFAEIDAVNKAMKYNLNSADFDVIQDEENHVSVRPKNDASLGKLKEWASTKDGMKDGGNGPVHDNITKVAGCKY